MLKILIIDDDDIILLVQRKLLQRCGINAEIHTFKNGIDALIFLKNLPLYDPVLILLDINMPRMNGWQFLSQVNGAEGLKHLYVIMVTSSLEDFHEEAAVEYNQVIGFLEKPVTMENCEKIKSMAELKKYF